LNKILVIDDEDKLRSLLSRILSLEGFEVLEAGDCRTALRKLEQTEIDVIICDVKLPDGNGVDLSKQIKQMYPLSETILLTAYGNIPDGVQSIKDGAFDYITKGDDNNKIIPLVHRASEKVALAKRIQHLEKQLGDKHSFDNIVGHSKAAQVAIELAKKVASTDATVLLSGETGTGKEIFAQAIHQASPRQNRNFVAVNCSAFSRELLESEMFGHKAGAFTGAIRDRKGVFEEANHGTIFLDELGEMPLDLQAKLLRVIESGEFMKVGESKSTKVDVRIIAATHKDLEKEIEEGRFREDLYYRVSVFKINLPPLRERVADIETLAWHFMSVFADKSNKKIINISEEYMECLKLHSWKGNIRELKNIIERSVILTNGTEINTDTLPAELRSGQHNSVKNKSFSAFELASSEKIHIQKVLNYTSGNKSETARLLNIALTTLYRKIEEYGLE
jgi:two-component system NtrC family response regulator